LRAIGITRAREEDLRDEAHSQARNAVILRSVMNVLDLIKATIACGLSAFLIYSFPVVSQVVIIGLLSLLWLSYAHRTLATLLRR
jgi:hypothetical protein